MRFSTPCSRRKVRFMASALNVVDITASPAIPGTMTFSVPWSPEKIAPNRARNSSGSAKLKKAALGLRQNIRRSSRYWRQVRASTSGTDGLLALLGGELEVDVLERRAGDRQVAKPLAAGERRARQLVQERRRVVGLAGHHLAVVVAPGHPVARGARAQRGRRALGHDPPLLDDRHAVAQRLRLVEVVRGEQDRLAQVLQRADDLPRVAPRRGIEARRRLVEEDQLRVADEGQGEVEPAPLAAGEGAHVGVRLLLQAGDRDDLLDVARVRVEVGEVLQRLARRDVAVHAGRLQDDADPLAQLPRVLLWIVAEHGDDPGRAGAVALEDLDRGRLAGAVGAEQAEDLADGDLEVEAPHGLVLAVGLAQVADEDGRCGSAHLWR